MPFPEILKELREKNAMTQEQLGKQLNMSKNVISHYENGVNSPNIDTLKNIADIFDVSIDYLVGRTAFSFKFSLFRKHFSSGTTLDNFLQNILSMDSKHKEDALTAIRYIKLDNDITHTKKK